MKKLIIALSICIPTLFINACTSQAVVVDSVVYDPGYVVYNPGYSNNYVYSVGYYNNRPWSNNYYYTGYSWGDNGYWGGGYYNGY